MRRIGVRVSRMAAADRDESTVWHRQATISGHGRMGVIGMVPFVLLNDSALLCRFQ